MIFLYLYIIKKKYYEKKDRKKENCYINIS